MAGDRRAYAKDERVEVRRLSGWRPGTVVGSSRVMVGGTARLFYVVLDGEQFEKPYRADQLRPLAAEPGAPACAGCAALRDENSRLKAEIEGLKTQVRFVTQELRKWVDAG